MQHWNGERGPRAQRQNFSRIVDALAIPAEVCEQDQAARAERALCDRGEGAAEHDELRPAALPESPFSD